MLRKFSVIILIIFLLLGFWTINIVKSIDTTQIEKKIVYKPSSQIASLIPKIAKKAEEKTFISPAGIKINYLQIKGDKKYPVILFCHGNAGNFTRNDNQDKIKFLVQHGYEVFTFDYRGFGKSSGSPDEQGLYNDLDSFISYLNKKYKISNSQLVLWGHSMGSAVVIEEASKKNFMGVITEGAFTSADDMKNYRILHKRNANPVHLFVRDYLFNHLKLTQKFSSKDKIAKIKSPMLIIHAVNDEMIPVEMSQQLSKLKPDAVTYFSQKGHHCDSGWQDKSILEFLKKLS